ncbi:MAG TPA: PIG-L family deacetylase [Thermomicrobiales bacterium]
MAQGRDVVTEVTRPTEAAQRRAIHIFLAPHYDDVALSCGGTVAALADGGDRPQIVTVFGGEPPADDLTAFARWQHERWGTATGDTIATRLAEDEAAAAILGCDTQTLPFLDAIYRGDGYLSDEALFGTLLAADFPLAEQIVTAVIALPAMNSPADTVVYVPLAIGDHVDHQLVYRVGRLLAERGWRVLAYEDFPYVVLGDAANRRHAAIAGEIGSPQVRSIAATLMRRLDAIAAYGSQLPVIFRFTDDWRAAVVESVRAVGGGIMAAERFWPLDSRA